ncbi:MAG: hypothetical protein M1826_001871 [Phylliscum demangeonii]|nr:MAG: hypothetical protein M1826_001871 [Phylliscum demangeonii]
MEHDPRTPPYRTADHTSFAYVSARDRWPVIITGMIDDMHRSAAAADEPAKMTEGKRIIEQLATLKYELQHDRNLTPIPDDGFPDIVSYNRELAQRRAPTWFDVPWLYSECYLYRRVNALFASSDQWKDHDVFARQKISAFRSSRRAVLELAAKYRGLMAQLKPDPARDASPGPERSEEADKLLFREMCEICLWGNATDLSILSSATYKDIEKLQGSEARKNAEKNILVDDLPAAYQALKHAQQSQASERERRVDIVLDNAGFELYVDLILAGYLLATDLATTVVLHPKSMPWFVSDVVPRDFADLLTALADPSSFFTNPTVDDERAGRTPQPLTDQEESDVASVFGDWAALHAQGKLVIRPHRFWTQAGSYWRLPAEEPVLLEDFKSSELVIFKGDLNYRKLTGDAMWDPTTSFATALGPLGERSSGIRVLALRTCKADVVVGLRAGEDERLRATEGGGGDSGARKWAWSGKWAVVQFVDGKDGSG